jgi:putative membrane protein
VAYNLDIFEVFVVEIPRTRRVASYILGVSLLAGLLTYQALLVGDDVTAWTELPGLAGTEAPTALVLVAAFGVAALVGGELTQLLVPSYPRNWGHYLALVCLVLAGVLLPIAVLLGGAADSSPAPVWFALGVAFLSSAQVLVISDDIPGVWRQIPASAVQPALLFAGLTAATPLSLSLSTHAPYIAVLVGVGLGLVLVSAFAESLMRANVSEVRAFEITANLVQRTPLHLGMGFSKNVPVQTFAVATEGGRTKVAAPWVHPGILERIGGAKLTPSVLAALNRDHGGVADEADGPSASDGGTSERGFFWHVPCTHLSDSPDPDVHEPVLDAVGDPETTGEASRLVSRTYDGTTFHGRRYGENRVVFFESEEFADIEAGIFGEVIDPERTLVVDRHVRVEDTDRREIHTESPEADRLRGYLRDFLSVLDEQPLARYHAGDAVDLDVEGISLFALVEEVDGQRTAYVVADRNERPFALVNAREQLDEFDEVLLFTTDTHASVTENRFDPQTRPNQIQDLVAAAADEVTDAEAGLTAERTEVELMSEDYQRLMFSLNILARIYIVSLAGLYVLLAVGLVLA